MVSSPGLGEVSLGVRGAVEELELELELEEDAGLLGLGKRELGGRREDMVVGVTVLVWCVLRVDVVLNSAVF